jgi:hypothetical protein
VSEDDTNQGVGQREQAETRLDEALEMTFPASDPVAIFRSHERLHDDRPSDDAKEQS